MDQIREAEEHDRADMARRLRLAWDLLDRWKADLPSMNVDSLDDEASWWDGRAEQLERCIKELELALKGEKGK